MAKSTKKIGCVQHDCAACRKAKRRAQQLRKISETCCSACDYYEAEGGLFNHCDKCCRAITTALWKFAHQENSNG